MRPIVTVRPENSHYRLYVESETGPNPAGPRLARGVKPLPGKKYETDETRFIYPNEDDAKEIAKQLQEYIDELIWKQS